MDIYCIKTHSQRAVIKGNIYTVVSDRCPCRCNAVDVGSPVPDEFMYYEDGRMINLGDIIYCEDCATFFREDGIFWIDKSLFVNIDEINIDEAIECINENELSN